MNEKDDFKEFINNPYTKKFLEYYEAVMCNAVSTISAACDEITMKKSRRKSGEISEILNCINSQCSGLMRAAEFSVTLRRLAENSDEEVIDIMYFLDFFAGKCSSIVGNVCKFNVSGDNGIIVKVQRSVINYAMLEFVRCYALKYGKNINFSLSCVCENSRAFVNVTVGVPESENEFPRKSGINFFESYFDIINEILKAKSSVRYEYKENSMTIEMPQYSGKIELDLLNRQIIDNKGTFSEYHVMLDDINNDLEFY